jgi:hypothetical protein
MASAGGGVARDPPDDFAVGLRTPSNKGLTARTKRGLMLRPIWALDDDAIQRTARIAEALWVQFIASETERPFVGE